MAQNFEFVHSPGGDTVRIKARGREVLTNPLINFGTAFTREQRIALNINGLLPPNVMTLNTQLKRVYAQFRRQPDDLSKFVYLNTMHDRNEVLYYKLLTEHIEEMLPIVYTPTIGQAIQEYSHWYHRPRGVYLSIDDPEGIVPALKSMGHSSDEIDLIVVTDSEGILGIGDQGVGGVAITVGKLSVYTAAAGIHPHRVLPVVLDTGTDNLDLLTDDAYLGVRHARIRGQQYDDFIEQFVTAANTAYPHAMLHWEDFGAANAHRILERYRQDYCTINDDIQGTAAVVVAAAVAAVARTGTRLADQRIIIYGAGTAGVGIANLMTDVMVADGVPLAEARQRFWCLGSRGLLREGLSMREFQAPYARSASELTSWTLSSGDGYELSDVVHNVRPTMLIGASAQSGAFTEAMVRDMAIDCAQPIILPLSNPTAKAEAIPADLLEWTDGRALIATGSPFEPVQLGRVRHTIAQANNALVFPGIGLGVIACRASRVTDGMIAAAARAVAAVVSDKSPGASLLPPISQLRSVSTRVAIAVADAAAAEGVAGRPLTNPVQQVYEQMWQPRYPRVEVV
ncbi:MAG TPA: NAD-dependent malic enzyme [Propionibacteriaceae bacterium]|nr:NAD-dependent malic enzyme [Propionibacteriaceae bacterium]